MTGLWPRRVPPAYTPLSFGAIAGAATAAAGRSRHAPDEFRRLLCQRYEADDALLLDSGTHALELAMRLAVRVSREAALVALPAYTCYDVATAAVGAGVRIVLYDVDPNTLAPDLESLGRAFEVGARVAMVSPLYGIAVDWDAVESAATPFGAVVIEDAAQGYGSEWRSRALGSLGRISVLSFGRGKGWTGGLGGALLVRGGITLDTDDDPSFRPPRAPAFAGLLAASGQWALSRPALFGVAASVPWLRLGETRYHVPDPPRSLPRGAVVLLQRTRELAARESAVRRGNGAALLNEIADADNGLSGAAKPIRPSPLGTAGYLRFPLRLRAGLEGFADPARARSLGAAGAYPTTLDGLAAVRERMVEPASQHRWPGADELVRELVTVPTHSQLTPADHREIVQLLRTAAR